MFVLWKTTRVFQAGEVQLLPAGISGYILSFLLGGMPWFCLPCRDRFEKKSFLRASPWRWKPQASALWIISSTALPTLTDLCALTHSHTHWEPPEGRTSQDLSKGPDMKEAIKLTGDVQNNLCLLIFWKMVFMLIENVTFKEEAIIEKVYRKGRLMPKIFFSGQKMQIIKPTMISS